MSEVITATPGAESGDRPKPPPAGQARRLARVLDRARVLHRVRHHLLRARSGDAPAHGRTSRTAQMVDFFRQHATTIQIGFCVLILIVGGAGVSNGIVVFHMKRMTTGR